MTDRVHRKVLAWAPMYASYYLGVFFSWLFERCPDKWHEAERTSVLFNTYNKCMIWSVDLNDWAGFDLWHPAK